MYIVVGKAASIVVSDGDIGVPCCSCVQMLVSPIMLSLRDPLVGILS